MVGVDRVDVANVVVYIVTAFASGCFVPCVPEIAKDLNTTGTIIK